MRTRNTEHWAEQNSAIRFPNPNYPKFLNLNVWRLTSHNAKFMLHEIFTRSVILVWRVQGQVRNLTSIKASKSLNLHHVYNVSSSDEFWFSEIIFKNIHQFYRLLLEIVILRCRFFFFFEWHIKMQVFADMCFMCCSDMLSA